MVNTRSPSTPCSGVAVMCRVTTPVRGRVPVRGRYNKLCNIPLHTDTHSNMHTTHSLTHSQPTNIKWWHPQNLKTKVIFSCLNDDTSHPKCLFPIFLTSELRNKGSKKLDLSPFSRFSWISNACSRESRAHYRACAGIHIFPEVDVTMKKIWNIIK